MFAVQPVLAAGCESLAIFAAISFVVWIVNQINAAQGKKAAGPRPGQPVRRNRPSHVQREIDRFIREATGKNRPDDVVAADDIEIVDEPRRRRPPNRLPPAPSPLATAPAKPQPALRDSLSSHVEHYIGDHVEEHIDSSVDDSVREHLGAFQAQSVSAARSALATNFLKDLRTPDGVRKAVLMQEILQRPRVLRR